MNLIPNRLRVARIAATVLTTTGAILAASPASASVIAPTAASVSSAQTASANAAGTHHLYAETLDASGSDVIRVYSMAGATATQIEQVTASTAPQSQFFDAHHLVIATFSANGATTRCLLFASGGDQSLHSYPIAADGTIPATPASTLPVGGQPPSDISVSGSRIFYSAPQSEGTGGFLGTAQLGAGCTLTAGDEIPTAPEQDDSVAALSKNSMVTADLVTGNLVFYSVTRSGHLAEIAQKPGALKNADGVVVWKKAKTVNIFTGQALTGRSSVQAYQDEGPEGLAPFSGSPQLDGNPFSYDGLIVAIDSGFNLLFQTGPLTAIDWYSLQPGSPGSPGSIAYTGGTNLTDTLYGPTALAVGRADLFVNVGDGRVEACPLMPEGLGACHTIANPGGTGVAGLAYL